MSEQISREEFDAVVERLEKVEQELEEERERRREAEQERDELRERVDELEDEIEDRAAVRWDSTDHADAMIESTDGARYPLGRAISSKVGEGDLEHLVEDLLEDVDLEATSDDVDDQDALLPIQQIAQLPEDVAKQQLDNAAHKNTYRARNVWKDVTDYCEKTPKGLVLRSGELRRVLTALEEGETRVESRTALRVMERIEDYSHGVVERKKRDGEWILVIPRDFEKRAKEVATDETDTVVTG